MNFSELIKQANKMKCSINERTGDFIDREKPPEFPELKT